MICNLYILSHPIGWLFTSSTVPFDIQAFNFDVVYFIFLFALSCLQFFFIPCIFYPLQFQLHMN